MNQQQTWDSLQVLGGSKSFWSCLLVTPTGWLQTHNFVYHRVKVLARILANRVRILTDDPTGTVQNYAMKGRLIQNIFHLVREILEGIEDSICADEFGPIQSFEKALGSSAVTSGFELKFRRWISILWQSPVVLVQGNVTRSGSFTIKQSI